MSSNTSYTTDLVYTPRRDWVSIKAPAYELAQAVADTEFVPKALRHNPAAITAAILYGDEIGLGPMQSLAKIAVIDGRPALYAEAQRALILAAGHELWVEEATTTRATIAGRRRGSDQISRITWTMDDAKRANLAGRGNWRAYPRQMLTARASAELARAIFADAIGGLGTIEELDADLIDVNGAPLVADEPAPTQRRKRSTPATVAPPSPAPIPSDVGDDGPPLPGEDGEGSPGVDPVVPVGDPAPGASPAPPPPDPPDLPPSEEEPKKRTTAQATKLNVLIGALRDPGHITTDQLWVALAGHRNIGTEDMIQLLDGRDDAGELHWAPLRDSLTRPEASLLIDWLTTKQERIARAVAEENPFND